MSNVKKENGITLVSLIVTIIILLILATVSISLVINNNVLDKAKYGVDKYSDEEELEQIKLAVAAAMLKGNGFLDTENLNSELHERIDGTENAEKIGNNYYYNGFVISEDGNVEKYDKLLPKEYQQVEYIESSGEQYIDTGVIQSDYTNNLKGYADFQFTKLDDISTVGGCRKSSISCYFFMFLADSSKFQSNIGKGNFLEITIANSDFDRHVFEFDSHLCTCKYDNNTSFDYFNSNASVPYSIYLFAYNDNNDRLRKSSVKIYRFSLSTKDDIYIRNLIPCYTTTTVTDVDRTECSAGTVGLYDTVTGQFYTNKETGTFGYGMEDGTYVAPTSN